MTADCFTQCSGKLIEPDQLEDKVAELKASGSTIASLNGSFDLLHAGHLHIIHEASKQADILIVALNSDHSIKQYKSLKRPIIELKYRLQMMSALAMVNFVTWFEEPDPRQLLEKMCPHVHVNGVEYGAECIEKWVVEKGGGRVHIVPLVPVLSTSAIIEKIQEL